MKKERPSNGLVKLEYLLPEAAPRPPKQPSKTQLRVIEAAASLDEQTIMYQHTIFCQAGLPYRDPGDTREWSLKNGNVSLKVQAGEAMHPVTKEWTKVGLPFGTKARLILGDLNTQAILTQKPEIEIEKTLSRYVKRLGGHNSGQDIKAVKEAFARLCASSFLIGLLHDNGATTYSSRIVSGFDLWFPKDVRQRVLWPSIARLSADYFELLLAHAVPLDEEKYFSLSHSALAMDIYAWLAQRLHRVHKQATVLISWRQLHLQFGWHYKRLDHFRDSFKVALKQVLVAYQAAQVEMDSKGLTLKNSPRPVAKTQLVVSSCPPLFRLNV
jgi:hypothetical protein